MQRFKNILYVVGGDPGETCGVARALALARANNARLTIAGLAELPPPDLPLPAGGLSADAIKTAILGHLEGRLREVAGGLDGFTVETQVLTGTPFLEVIRAVLRNGHDLVVKCVDATAGGRRPLGSDDLHLLRKCPCPVWLNRPESPSGYRCVLAAVDVERLYPPREQQTRWGLSRQILEMACSLARRENAELHVAHVWHATGEGLLRGGLLGTPEAEIEAYLAAERRRHAAALGDLIDEVAQVTGIPARPVRHLPKGWPREELPALARRIGADVLVLGTVARTGVPGLLIGNTAESVLNQVDCAVLALKPEGFVTPVTA